MIRIRHLTIQEGNFTLSIPHLDITKGTYFVILGHTGSGKTVLLEAIAGLRLLKTGEVWINGENATTRAAEKRKVGYVPQDYVLFPFLNVYENIAFGLKEVNCRCLNMDERVKHHAQLLGISHLLSRGVNALSGGEKQRVALARALVLSPKVLLLDEPLSNLDLQTGKHMRLVLKRIHQGLKVTIIHVTHNQSEAEEISDQIAVISHGEIVQVGRPEEVFFSPENAAVSDFIGKPNILNCDSYKSVGQGLVEVECGGLHIIVPHDEDTPITRIAISPRDIYISDLPFPGPSVNRFSGAVTEIKQRGDEAEIGLKVDGQILRSEAPISALNDMGLVVGKEIYLMLKLRRIKIC